MVSLIIIGFATISLNIFSFVIITLIVVGLFYQSLVLP
jgi:hypothetical protein